MGEGRMKAIIRHAEFSSAFVREKGSDMYIRDPELNYSPSLIENIFIFFV